MDLSFYNGKKVLVTGHTGFKGTWMCKVLKMQGAHVVGYSLEAPTNPSLYKLTNMEEGMTSIIGDIRDLDHLNKVFSKYEPEIVIHMAAQPIVRESYMNPVYTYDVNVMGTVNILEAVRLHTSVKSFVNVTTDKVYQNNEWEWGYRENDILDGYDPYSNSKSCSELVTSSYKKSFFNDSEVAVSTCRAGNVIGGGDFAKDRIIPDCIRAQEMGKIIIVRNPYSVRPYQHVLEPVSFYLHLAQMQYYDKEEYEGSYNVGPDECDSVTTGELVGLFCKFWEGATWEDASKNDMLHEASYLRLDCSKIKKRFGWRPKWHIEDAVKYTVEWSKAYLSGKDVTKIMEKQIDEYLM